MSGKELTRYGLITLLVYYAYKILSPLIDWIVYLIPSAAMIMIIVGCIKMYKEK